MNTTNLIISACLAVSLGNIVPSHAQDPRPAGRPGPDDRRGEPGPGRGFPGSDSLTPEEREKLRAAQQKAMQDDSVRIAEAAMRDATRAFREAVDAAILAADPSLE